jgi:microcin C transport system substrate-binding protein
MPIGTCGLQRFGYPSDFAHFSCQWDGRCFQIGRTASSTIVQTFNSLNSFILKGDAAQGMELTFATLMVQSGDEPDDVRTCGSQRPYFR